MTAGDIIALFRSESVEANRHFIGDSELFRYLQSGYIEFVRQTNGTPDALLLDISQGEPDVELPPYIMRLKSVRKLSDQGEIQVINYTDLTRPKSGDYGVTNLSLNLVSVGVVRYMMVGAVKHAARLIAIPKEDDELELLIDRLPLNSIVDAKSPFTDIDEVHQIAMLDWLKASTFRRPNPCLFDPKLAEFFEGRFNQVVYEAGRSQDLFKSKVRTVQYGGV